MLAGPKIDTSQEQATSEFDFNRDFDHLCSIVDEIAAEYPSGALEWLVANRSDVIAGLRKCWNDVDHAFQICDHLNIQRRLDVLRLAYLKAWGIYKRH